MKTTEMCSLPVPEAGGPRSRRPQGGLPLRVLEEDLPHAPLPACGSSQQPSAFRGLESDPSALTWRPRVCLGVRFPPPKDTRPWRRAPADHGMSPGLVFVPNLSLL